MENNIIKVDYSDEMEQSYIDYAMSVIVQRAIPDLRDGLKPVHRRILYAMNELSLWPHKPYKKSARIVGDVLGKYHPHGDSSVYEAMVRLAQDFNNNFPLIKGQGNFGSIDGDPAAAMRYTEAKLEELSLELLEGLDRNIVNFRNNFDNSTKEPTVLPAKFFNLLVNGSTGIAVGMSTNIPPHNLNEVNNACIAFLKKPEISNKELLTYIKGPDFPTGGTIINKDELLKIYSHGNGRLKLRANLKKESSKGSKNKLIITEIPYTFAGNKTRLLESLISLINDKKLDELSDIRDESSKDGIRIVLEVKKGVDLNNLKEKLYNISRLEDTVSINMLSIVEGKPQVLSLKNMIKVYIDFLTNTYIKDFKYQLNYLSQKQEVKKGLLKAYDNIDLIIEIIQASPDKETALDCIVNGNCEKLKLKNENKLKDALTLKFSEIQGEAILKTQLQKLVFLEQDFLESELKKINIKIMELKKLINNKKYLNEHIINQLKNLNNKYVSKRRTRIINRKPAPLIKAEEIVEDVYVLIDRFNYLKVIDPLSLARANEDTLESYNHIIPCKSNDNIWIFADDAKFYQVKLKDQPIVRLSDRGLPLSNKINILYANNQESLVNSKLLFSSRLGYVKRVNSEEFITIRKELISTKISSQDDELISVEAIKNNHREVVLFTKNNRSIRFDLKEVPTQKRNAMGVRGINLNKNDFLIKVKLEKESNNKKRPRGAKGYKIK